MLGFFHQTNNPRWGSPVALAEAGISFFSNTLVRILIVFGLLLIGTSFSILAYFIRPTETPLVFHYNVYFGVDLLGAWWQTYIFSVLGIFFFLEHLLLAWYFYRRTERIAAYLLLLASGLLNLGLLIASVSVAAINY